jgi:phenylalanyl-tRNA synthetase beta chain
MRVPLRWLRNYVDIQQTPEQLAERLTLLGMEVKGIERWGADWRNVVTGELLEVTRHPRADRLSLTKVRVQGQTLEIVCGAHNIAAGQRIPVALPGAVLPGNRAIERTEKMGVVSNGMLCSGDELRLTGDGDGILILPADTPLDVPLVDLYGDWVLDVDVKPNRGDALCLLGLAREVSAATGAPVRFPEIRVVEAGAPAGESFAVTVEDPALCSRFVGRVVRGVRVDHTPDEIQMRLMAAGQRPVSNVVDASNYVMLELGKPTHAFDARAVGLDGMGRAHITVRLARAGERLTTLDHVERELTPDTLLITDASGPIGLAGVMGGADSEVTDATTDVIVESAVFDPVSVRRTAFRYALRSEASLRFEKGQESRLARLGADRVAELIRAWAGGEVAPGRVDTAPDEPTPATVAFRPARINRLLGTALGADEQAKLLVRVGIETLPAASDAPLAVAAGTKPLAVAAGDGALLAIVPTWRRDLLIEADVAEEIARVVGYDAVPTKTPDTTMPHVRRNPLERRDAIRRALAGAGLSEVVTPALVAARQAAALGWPVAGADGVAGQDAVPGRQIAVTNPLSERHAVLRSGLVASLLDVLAHNERQGRRDVAVFEIGKGYAAGPDGAPAEWWRLGILLTGTAEPAAWNRPARPYDLDDAKGVVELIAGVAGLPGPSWTGWADGAPLHPGRTARARSHGPEGSLGLAGLVGELHPDILVAWDLRAERVLVAELAVAGLEEGAAPVVRIAGLGRFPAVERDIALVVPETAEAATVAAVIREAGGPSLRDIRLFDVYRGTPLAGTEKSLAWRLAFRADDRMLTEDEVEAALAAVAGVADHRLGARVRT